MKMEEVCVAPPFSTCFRAALRGYAEAFSSVVTAACV